MKNEAKFLPEFVIEVSDIAAMFPRQDRQTASKRLYRIKRKLKKPKGSILLASEYCGYYSITMASLYRLLNKPVRYSGIDSGIVADRIPL